MIQSHYVPSERPYRIIYTGGVVGLQIGTLIVVDDRQTQNIQVSTTQRFGNRTPSCFYHGVRTFSYPVVSYINKETEKRRRITSDIAYDVNDYSESVVWNNVRMEDVATICLEGQRVPWDEMLPIIKPAIEKCIDMVTTRQELFNAFSIFFKVIKLGGSISMPEEYNTEYLSNGKMLKLYTVKLMYDSYVDEDGKKTIFYTTDDGDNLPFFALEGEEAYKILDYQRFMYERKIRLLDNSVGSQIKVYFEKNDSENEEINQKLEAMVNKLNARNK